MAYTDRFIAVGGTNTLAASTSGDPASWSEYVNAVPADKVLVEAGDYTSAISGAVSFPDGASTSPIRWEGRPSGFGAFVRDRGASGTQELVTTNMPLLDAGSSEFSLGEASNYDALFMRSSTGGTVCNVIQGSVVDRCRIEGTSTTAGMSAVAGPASYMQVIDSDVLIASSSTGARPVNISGARCQVNGCRIWNSATPGSTQVGVRFDLGSAVVGCIIFNLGYGINQGGYGAVIARNTIYDCNAGINLTNSLRSIAITDNVIYSMSSYGITGSTACATFIKNNAMGALTSGRLNTLGIGSTIEEVDGIILDNATSPFVDAASGDFRLNTTPTSGALCRAVSMMFDGYGDVGAVQHEDSGGGGGGGGASPIGNNKGTIG